MISPEIELPLAFVDVVIFTVENEQLKVLLVKRGQEPYLGEWALPGGYIDISHDKNIEETALRKLKEKTGAKTPYLEQLQSFGTKDRDPRGWSVTITYFALISSEGIILQHGSGTDEVRWWPVNNNGVNVRLAFDHKKILETAINRLRNKVEYTALPVHLLPKEFTLSELKKIFEIILARPVDKSAFRKRVMSANLIEEVSNKKRLGSNRPAQLYKIKRGQMTIFFPRTFYGAGSSA